MGSIQLRTKIPGPKAVELLTRKAQNVPKAPLNTIHTFASKGEGALITDVDQVKPYKYEFGPFAPGTYKWAYPYYYRSEFDTPEQLEDTIGVSC